MKKSLKTGEPGDIDDPIVDIIFAFCIALCIGGCCYALWCKSYTERRKRKRKSSLYTINPTPYV